MEVLGQDFAHLLHIQAYIKPGQSHFGNLPYATASFNYHIITAFNKNLFWTRSAQPGGWGNSSNQLQFPHFIHQSVPGPTQTLEWFNDSLLPHFCHAILRATSQSFCSIPFPQTVFLNPLRAQSHAQEPSYKGILNWSCPYIMWFLSSC